MSPIKQVLSDAVDLIHEVLMDRNINEELRLKLSDWRKQAEIFLERGDDE